jgi:hypothetical protein
MNPTRRFRNYFKRFNENQDGMPSSMPAHRAFNYYVNSKQTLGLIFLFLAFTVFTIVAYSGGDIARILVIVYGLIVAAMAIVSLYGYLKKTVDLQNNKDVRRYVAINTVNTFVGLIVPVILLNEVIRSIVTLAAQITNYGTVFCQFRCTMVRAYWRSDIYTNVNTLLFWSMVILFAYWLIGGFIERYLSRE